MATTDEQWDGALDTAETLGAPYVGAGSNPEDFATSQEWVAFAERIDSLGAAARELGMRYLIHLHDWEFAPVEDGDSAFDLLVANTAAGDRVDFYVIERDPPQDDASFDPFGPTVAGLRFLRTVKFSRIGALRGD